MIPEITPLFILGIGFSFTGLIIGGSYALRWSDDPTPKFVMPTFITLCAVGLLLIGIEGIQEHSQIQSKEKLVANEIESMSCSQLHDALLHNTINGTDHVQRATERYVSGCETK